MKLGAYQSDRRRQAINSSLAFWQARPVIGSGVVSELNGGLSVDRFGGVFAW